MRVSDGYHFRQQLGTYSLPNRGRGSIAIGAVGDPFSNDGANLSRRLHGLGEDSVFHRNEYDQNVNTQTVIKNLDRHMRDSGNSDPVHDADKVAINSMMKGALQQQDFSAKLSRITDNFFAEQTALQNTRASTSNSDNTSKSEVGDEALQHVQILDTSSLHWYQGVLVAVRDMDGECDILPSVSTEIDSMLVKTVPFECVRESSEHQSFGDGENLDIFNADSTSWISGFESAGIAFADASFVKVRNCEYADEVFYVPKKLLRKSNQSFSDSSIGNTVDILDTRKLRWHTDLHVQGEHGTNAASRYRVIKLYTLPHHDRNTKNALLRVALQYRLEIQHEAAQTSKNLLFVPQEFVSVYRKKSLTHDQCSLKNLENMDIMNDSALSKTLSMQRTVKLSSPSNEMSLDYFPANGQPASTFYEDFSTVANAPKAREVYKTNCWVSPKEKDIKMTKFVVRKSVVDFVKKVRDSRDDRQDKTSHMMRVAGVTEDSARSGISNVDNLTSELPKESWKLYTTEDTHVQYIRGQNKGVPQNYRESWNISTSVPKSRRRTLRHTVFDEMHAMEHPYKPKQSFNPLPFSVYRKLSPEKRYKSAVAAKIEEMRGTVDQVATVRMSEKDSFGVVDSLLENLGTKKAPWKSSW